MTMRITKRAQREEELANLRQRIEELEKATSAVTHCDCCGKEIRSGNACVEFMRREEKTEVDLKGNATAILIDEDLLALICADCGGSYSNTINTRRKLSNTMGLPDHSSNVLSESLPIATKYHKCDSCSGNMEYSYSKTYLYTQIAQINRDAKGIFSFTDIRFDDLFTFCNKCSYSLDRDRVEDSVRKMLGDDNDSYKKQGHPDVGTESKPVKIIDVGAEGGGITLFGWKDEKGVWHYLRETDERTLMNMMPEDDQKGLCFYSKSDSTTDWDEAIKLMYRYPWPCLYPLYVHPEFVDLVMIALKNAPERYRERINFHNWDVVCTGKSRL